MAAARILLDALQEANYSAVGLGSRDLAAGVPFLLEEAGRRKLRLLSANVTFNGNPAFESHALIPVAGLKVGVLAVTGPLNRPISEGVAVGDPMAAAKALVPEIAKQAGIVVLLSSLGHEENLKLAEEVPGIDIVISGGGGASLYQPLRIRKTWFLRPTTKGKSIGQAALRLDGQGRLAALESQLILLDDTLPEDEGYAKRLTEFAARFPAPASGPGAPMSSEAAENPFLKALQEKIKERQAQGPPQTPPAEAQPLDPKANPLLELLQRLKEQQQKTQGPGADPGAPQPDAPKAQ